MTPTIHEKKTFKGVQRAARDTLTHKDYFDMFKQLPREDGLPHTVINRHFVSRLHQIYTEEQEKRGLVPFDDKRYLLANLPDGSPNPNTHAYGHYSIYIQQHQILDAPKDLPLDLTGRPLTEGEEDDAHLPSGRPALPRVRSTNS